MRKEMKAIQNDFHTTIIYVTHDQDEAMAMSDRIVLMNKGHIEQEGTPDELKSKPATEFVREFLN
jgi:ABC-type sugar transport system ATPase subunit